MGKGIQVEPFFWIEVLNKEFLSLMFVFAENIEESLAFRAFLLIFPPIAFIVIIMLIIGRFIGARK